MMRGTPSVFDLRTNSDSSASALVSITPLINCPLFPLRRYSEWFESPNLSGCGTIIALD